MILNTYSIAYCNRQLRLIASNLEALKSMSWSAADKAIMRKRYQALRLMYTNRKVNIKNESRLKKDVAFEEFKSQFIK